MMIAWGLSTNLVLPVAPLVFGMWYGGGALHAAAACMVRYGADRDHQKCFDAAQTGEAGESRQVHS
eukprot:6420710-Amphidinium_carterae.2